jgi:Fe2+ or Zn2+ uptake regulation protein
MITKNKTERITNQKKVILDYLKSVKIHPDAEKVYFEVKKKLPRISLGTVYRILNNLSEKKEIRKIPAEISRFDGDISSHAHYICEKCHAVFDIFNICKDCRILKNKKTKVGKIENYQIYFYGICKKCSKKPLPGLPRRNKG